MFRITPTVGNTGSQPDVSLRRRHQQLRIGLTMLHPDLQRENHYYFQRFLLSDHVRTYVLSMLVRCSKKQMKSRFFEKAFSTTSIETGGEN
jgi:hypothetical protein